MRDPEAGEDLRDEMTRHEAVALYYARCRALRSQIAHVRRELAELRNLRAKIRQRWGRPPAWPQW